MSARCTRRGRRRNGRRARLHPPGWGVRCLGIGALLFASLLSGGRSSGAEPPRAAPVASAAAMASAKTLFRAGAEAYAEGNFLAALHAFDAARALAPDPALTFSIAQAHRRLYQLEGWPASLRSALGEYRRYLDEVKKGGRRADAHEAIAELEPRLDALEETQGGRDAPVRVATRLMVLSSVVGAEVMIDGGPAEQAPYIGEIEAGTHVVRVEAPGYRPYERTVVLRAGDVLPIDAVLEDLPAELWVQGAESATLWIDGRPTGRLPLAGPVAVSPGRRLVAVTKDGYRRFELETRLERGERKTLAVALESTPQRTVSVVTIALGAGSLVAGGIFAGVGASAYGDAEAIYDKAQVQNITSAELDRYNGSREDYQPWMVAAIATGAVGVALGLTGSLAFVLDEPAPPSQVVARTARPSPAVVAVGAQGSPERATIGATVRF